MRRPVATLYMLFPISNDIKVDLHAKNEMKI